MTKYAAGKPFPLHNYADGTDKILCALNEGFFDVLCYLTDPINKEVEMFRTGKLRYGVYRNEHVPFFLIDFIGENWNCECSINIHKAQEDMVENWLNSDANTITIYLIDANSNILKSMRLIGIKQEVAEEIRDILEKQDEVYSSASEVNSKINSLMAMLSTQDMITRAKMHNL